MKNNLFDAFASLSKDLGFSEKQLSLMTKYLETLREQMGVQKEAEMLFLTHSLEQLE